ncbi:FecR domain-containing protein, partial [Acidovorax sp. CCYZU-2555]|uniref:FecR family protein n=1 Tax=Acidovorax sp. CCYZU-2555 TaxID=2835042 RepID=UPI001BD1AAE0
WWDQHPSYVLDIATGPGEMRAVALPDGTRVTLNFDSRLAVRYYPRRRNVELAGGEAFFQVAPDAHKPFTVDSGASQVRVVGTAFNLRSGPPQFVVKVLEGQVEVRPDRRRADAPVLQLGAGAGVSVDAASGRHTAVPAAADAVGDWRNGQLVFAQTPLAEVAAELARYLGKPVRVEGARLAALPVSGMAITDAPAGFLRALPMLLPVRVQDLGEDGWRISAR